jgi:hypothetical protein
MVTVHRASGMSVVIYLDDHEPAHVHVFGDGEAKIELLGPDEEPKVVWTKGMNRAEARRALAAVRARRDDLLLRRNELHG